MRTILVVEDSPLLLQMVSTVLRSKGFEVIEAVNAYEAMKISDGRPLDLVITDLIMPGMDGIELARHIRSQGAYCTTPILMLTTQSTEQLKRDGSAAGVNVWVVKPFSPEHLTTLIRKILGGGSY
jgi:two-component system, chemotaxis family, chemotaxis protein CheY